MKLKKKRLLAGVALAASAALLLTGCSLGQKRAESSPAPTKGIPEKLVKFYTQKLAWSNCSGGMQCAKTTAPLDWANPASHENVSLAMRKLPASGKKIGTLFVNPGGPGASGVDFLESAGDRIVDPSVREHYDIVAWDPRGTGHSTNVKCFDDKGMDEELYPQNEPKATDPGYRDYIINQTKKLAAACKANSGKLLAYVDTESTDRDLDMLRGLVGDEKLHYFGFSYGTLIGAKYAGLFPDRVGRMVLDGAEDPSVPALDESVTQAQGFQQALETYVQSCQKNNGCPLQGSMPDGMRQLDRLLDDLDAHPIQASDGRQLNASVMSTAISASLYSKDEWLGLTNMLRDVIQRRNADAAFKAADNYNDRASDGHYTSNMMEAFTAISCMDHPLETDPQKIAKYEQEMAAVDPYDETPAPATGLGDAQCAEWPYQSRVKQDLPVMNSGSAQIVVIGTTRDPATPLKWAQGLAAQLTNSSLIIFNGDGHTAYNQGDSCVTDPVDNYLVTGETLPNVIACGV